MNIRVKALLGFAIAITVLNTLGHTILGFEQSLLQVMIALLTAYLTEILIEVTDSKVNKRKTVFSGSLGKFIIFLLPAHITGLAIGMLLYANSNVLPFAFATALAISTKAVFQVKINGKEKHFLNPSNSGIALTLLLFPWVSIAPPYHFTENVYGYWNIIIPFIILTLGTMLNSRLTKRTPLILAWLIGFIIQAIARSLITDISLIGALLPVTGLAFLLFTFYMITDPGTTPYKPMYQVIFGLSVAMVYGILMMFHVVFTLFFSLFIVCLFRGAYHSIKNIIVKRQLKSKGGNSVCVQE